MLKIFHNPKCAKSRAGLEYLKSKTNEFVVVDYIRKGLSIDDIKEIILKTNLKPIDLVRKQEDIFKKELKGRSFNDDEWIKIIIENPKLLKRPVIIAKHKAVVEETGDNIDTLIY
jgi:arsenate reductase